MNTAAFISKETSNIAFLTSFNVLASRRPGAVTHRRRPIGFFDAFFIVFLRVFFVAMSLLLHTTYALSIFLSRRLVRLCDLQFS